MQPSVQFVLTLSGVRSSPLILMSSPGFRFTGAQRPGVGGVGVEGDINTPTQTRGMHHISSSQTQIFLNRKRRLGTSAHQSWGLPCGTFLQDPTCTARVSPGVAVTY